MNTPASRRLFSRAGRLTALFCLIAPWPAHAATPAKRPNVLLLFSDDMRTELGCYGTPGIKTPHIDALARRSVRFDRAYVQYPLCNPSRSSLLTGRYPTATGVLGNTEFLGSRRPEWDTLPMYFRKHGYTTLRTGKIFHGGYDDTDAWVEGGEPRLLGNADRKGSTQDPKRSDSIVVLEGDGETSASTAAAGSRSSSRAVSASRTARRRPPGRCSIFTMSTRSRCPPISPRNPPCRPVSPNAACPPAMATSSSAGKLRRPKPAR